MTGAPPAATRWRAQSLIRCCVANESGMYACSAMPAATFSRPGRSSVRMNDLGREVLVAVLLHVEIDELRHDACRRRRVNCALRGGAVQQFQPIAEHVDRVLAGERRDLRVDRRDLDRDDFDLGLLQRCEIRLQPALGILLAEQRFAEEVDVHPHAFFAAALARCSASSSCFGRQNDVRRLLLHLLLHQRHRHAGQVRAEGLKALAAACDRAR